MHAGYIIELVEEGVIEPVGREPHCWRFTGAQMRRADAALRLQRDLGINLAGVALALQLLDEAEALRAQIRATGEVGTACCTVEGRCVLNEKMICHSRSRRREK